MATTATTTLISANSSHLLHRHALPLPHPPNASAAPPSAAATQSRSPFDRLPADLVRAILTHVAGESLDRPITTDAYRFVLPFAAACRSHYGLVTRAVVGLSLLPLNFTLDRAGHRRRPPPFPPALQLPPAPVALPAPGALVAPPAPPTPPTPLPHARPPAAPAPRAPALCAVAPLAPSALDTHLPAAVTRLPALRVLHLFRNSQVGDSALCAIARGAPLLSELRLRANRSLSVRGVRALRQCARLAILDLSYCLGLSDECGDALARLPALHTLLLAYWPISDAFVATLAASPTLRDLCLTACSALTPLACRHLADAGRLTALRFRSSPTLDDGAVAQLARISSLATLDVALSRHVSDGALRALGDAGAPVADAVVGDAESGRGGRARPCTQLQAPVTRRGRPRGSAHSLTRLTLSQCAQITDAGVRSLCRNAGIRVLDLSFCHHITDSGVDALTRLPRLESLDLSGCRSVSDAAVVRLAALPWLCRVGLSRCTALTDGAASALCKAANRPLELVDVRNCFAISADALEELGAACVQLLRSPERC